MTWHVYPVNDLREHELTSKDGERCWCNPEYDEEDDIFIHNALDGREAYESGERELH